MYPHDYYAPYSDEPKLHNRGAARPYVEPDWQANAAGHQLPVLSTVGRGPRGEGLEIGNVVNEDDTVSFALYSTLTGELVWQSPNLAPSKIEFLPADFRDLAAGQAAPLDIKVTRGGVTETTHAYLPCGEQGSLIYVIPGVKDYNTSQTYQAKVGDLTIYNNNHWNNGHRPLPRVNDIVIVKIQQEDTVYLAVGDIVQVGSGVDHSGQNIDEETQLVYVVRTMIDNVGPKGDKGDPGSQVHVWEAEGNWFPYSPGTGSWHYVTRTTYDPEHGYYMPLAFICHVTSLDQFIPVSFYVSVYIQTPSGYDYPYEEMFMAGNMSNNYRLVPLDVVFTEWTGPSYAYNAVEDGYDIYFCPVDNNNVTFTTVEAMNEFLESYPTYKMYGTYMLDEEYEQPTIINGWDIRVLPTPM